MRRHYQVIVRALLILALGICFLHVLAASTAYAKSSQITFSLGPTGLAVQNGLLLVATRLNNTSDRNAFPLPGCSTDGVIHYGQSHGQGRAFPTAAVEFSPGGQPGTGTASA